jgi:hypothetical protein
MTCACGAPCNQTGLCPKCQKDDENAIDDAYGED